MKNDKSTKMLQCQCFSWRWGGLAPISNKTGIFCNHVSVFPISNNPFHLSKGVSVIIMLPRFLFVSLTQLLRPSKQANPTLDDECIFVLGSVSFIVCCSPMSSSRSTDSVGLLVACVLSETNNTCGGEGTEQTAHTMKTCDQEHCLKQWWTIIANCDQVRFQECSTCEMSGPGFLWQSVKPLDPYEETEKDFCIWRVGFNETIPKSLKIHLVWIGIWC